MLVFVYLFYLFFFYYRIVIGIIATVIVGQSQFHGWLAGCMLELEESHMSN